MRVLITGAGGLLGGRLSTLLASRCEVAGVVRRSPAPPGVETIGADLVDPNQVAAALARKRPGAVVHCAALADADVCERDPGLARRENVEATRVLAAACGATSTRLVTISTDLVFGGEEAYARETDEPRPIMEYGRSKLAAEAITLAAASDAVVLRVALISGRGFGPRLTSTEGVALRLARSEPVTLYEDEWRTPVDPPSVAAAILAVLERPKAFGCFHLAGPERLTRAEIGERVASTLGLDASLIKRGAQASHRGAPRPRDVSLDNTRAKSELGWSPQAFDLAIREGRLDPASTSAVP